MSGIVLFNSGVSEALPKLTCFTEVIPTIERDIQATLAAEISKVLGLLCSSWLVVFWWKNLRMFSLAFHLDLVCMEY